MAKIKFVVSNKFKPEVKIKNIVDQFNAQDLSGIGRLAVSEMKDLISKGISPIQGVGRFPAYKNPERYPKKIQKSYPGKKQRPVNLFLSGEFLKTLGVIKSSKGSVTIGFSTEESKEKESGHRDGANGQLKRPIIPLGKEKFAVSVERVIVNEMIRRLKALFTK